MTTDFTNLTPYEILKYEFDGEPLSFLFQLRGNMVWDKVAFQRLTQAMYEVATDFYEKEDVPKWIANGFWFAEQLTKEWSNHPNFPKPESEYHESSLELLYFLSDYLFADGVSLQDGALEIWVYQGEQALYDE